MTGEIKPHRVALVVDRHFGRALPALAADYHVWIVQSATNAPAIKDVWGRETLGKETDPLGTGVTAFEADIDEPADAICCRMAEEVAEHHGEFAHDPPWSEIRVVGVTLSPQLDEAFRAIGAVDVVAADDGFLCRR